MIVPPKTVVADWLTVRVAAPATLVVMTPAMPLKLPTVGLFPARSSVPPLAVSAPLTGKAAELPSCKMPLLLMVVPPP